MKNINKKLMLLLLCFVMMKAWGQTQNSCRTKPPHFGLAKGVNVERIDVHHTKFRGGTPNRPCKSATLQVVVHVIRNSSGLGGYNNPNIVTETITTLNQAFNSFDIYFQSKAGSNTIHYIDDDNIYNLFEMGNGSNSYGKFNEISDYTTDAIDVYFNGSGKMNGSYAAGIGATAIIMRGSVGATSFGHRTLCHEMGHALGLLHTFDGTACDEPPFLINRYRGTCPEMTYFDAAGNMTSTNGKDCGDHVEDTYADPMPGAIPPLDIHCREALITTDIKCSSTNPLLFDFYPLGNNFMDYDAVGLAANGCGTRFTNGQVERMKYTLANFSLFQNVLVKTSSPVSITTTPSNLNICSGQQVTLNGMGSNLYYYDWQPTNDLNVQSINVAPSKTTTYTLNANDMCLLSSTASVTVHVDDDADFEIAGPSTICEGNGTASYTINNLGVSTAYNVANGVWSISPNTTGYSITNSGVVTIPTGATQATISFSVVTQNGICTRVASKTLTIIPLNATISITAYNNMGIATNTVCDKTDVTLSANGPNGLNYTWNTGEIGQSMVIKASADDNIFSVSAVTPCSSNALETTITLTVNELPNVTITGFPKSVCDVNTNIPFNTYTYNQSNIEANWWVTNGVASFDNTLTPTAIVPWISGTEILGVHLTNTVTMCENDLPNITQVTILPTVVNIFGQTKICSGSTTQLTANVSGGKWETANASIARVDKDGNVTGVSNSVSAITAIIIYTVDLCGTPASAAFSIQIEPTPIFTTTNILDLNTPSYLFTSSVAGTWQLHPSGSNIVTLQAQPPNNVNVMPQVVGNVDLVFTPTAFTTCMGDPARFPISVVNYNNPNPCLATYTSVQNPIGYSYSGVLEINNDITITDDTYFSDANIKIAQGVTIHVTNNATLTISNCHLFSCGGMWKGIQLESMLAKVRISGSNYRSTLFEDAEIGINYSLSSPTSLNFGSDKIISVRNCIFNKNNISIKISNITKNLSGDDLPFEIGNSVFTSRAIPFDANIIAWQNVNTFIATPATANLPIFSTPNTYSAPYISNTNFKDYTIASCLQDGQNANKPFAGILFDNVGYYNANTKESSLFKIGSFTTANNNGGVNRNTNIFDNVDYGIKAYNSNFEANNCVFQNTNPSTVNSSLHLNTNGYGVFSDISNYVNISADGYPNNAFFDVNNAIEIANGGRVVKVNDCVIRSTQNINNNNTETKGNSGIKIYTGVYDNLEINNNTISNIRTAIVGSVGSTGRFITAPKMGPISCTNNTVAPTFIGAVGSTGYEYVENGINLSSVEQWGTGSETHNPVTIKDNNVSAYNGISASYFQGLRTHITYNTINAIEDELLHPTEEHFGLKLEGGMCAEVTTNTSGELGFLNTVEDNTINGLDTYINPDYELSGVLAKQQHNTKIQCNSVNKCRDGYKFFGASLDLRFFDNYIDISNQFGFTLDQAIIGQQGYLKSQFPTDPGTCTSNNNWGDANRQAWINAGHYMTRTNYSTPEDSRLIIKGGAGNEKLNPANRCNALPPNNIYDAIAGKGIYVTNSNSDVAAYCVRCDNPTAVQRTRTITELLEEIAAGSVLLPNDEANERLYVLQKQLYDLVKERPELANNSTDLQQFILNNQFTSLDFIYYLGYYAKRGNMGMVNNLLDYWMPSSKEVDENYYTYYNWLVEMYNDPSWIPNREDVLALANKCPLKGGSVVYAARNLYNALTKKINRFEDCEGNNARKSSSEPSMIRVNPKKVKEVIVDKTKPFVLYPNPATNALTLFSNDIVKQIDIYNHLGTIVISKKLNSKIDNLDITKIAKGVYLIRVTSDKGIANIDKFIKVE